MIRSPCIAIFASTTMLLGGFAGLRRKRTDIDGRTVSTSEGERDLSYNKSYLEGIKDGLVAYNMSVEDKLFCLGGMPPVLTFEQASDTLLKWARKRKGDAAGLSLGLALLYSLKEAFPCKSPPR